MQPIQTALCSFGMSGQVFHAPLIHVHPGFRLAAVWERTKNVAAGKYPGVRTCRSLEELLADEGVELVVVNTPNYTHFEYAKAALLAGRHVLVEKPFTVTTGEADELIRLSRSRGKLLSVYQNRRYDSDFRIIRQVLEKGLIGPVVEAEFHFDRYRPGLSAKVHKEEPNPGTGALYDLGSHLIDQALSLFGFPQAVFADLQKLRPHSQVDDFFEVLLYYPDLRVRLRCSYLVREALPGYVLHGRLGTFIKNRTDQQEARLQAGELPDRADWGVEPEEEWGLLHTEKEGRVIRERVPSPPGNYLDLYDGLYRAIREGAPPPVDPQEGRDVVRIIEAAFQSAGEKRVVSL